MPTGMGTAAPGLCAMINFRRRPQIKLKMLAREEDTGDDRTRGLRENLRRHQRACRVRDRASRSNLDARAACSHFEPQDGVANPVEHLHRERQLYVVEVAVQDRPLVQRDDRRSATVDVSTGSLTPRSAWRAADAEISLANEAANAERRQEGNRRPRATHPGEKAAASARTSPSCRSARGAIARAVARLASGCSPRPRARC